MKQILIIAVACILGLAAEQAPPAAVFTAAQAEAGKTAYSKTCINCHGETLIPKPGMKYYGVDVPPLAGPRFMERWGVKRTNGLSKRINEGIGGFPPPERNEQTYLEITAYVLQMNGAHAGEKPLAADTAVEVRSVTHE